MANRKRDERVERSDSERTGFDYRAYTTTPDPRVDIPLLTMHERFKSSRYVQIVDHNLSSQWNHLQLRNIIVHSDGYKSPPAQEGSGGPAVHRIRKPYTLGIILRIGDMFRTRGSKCEARIHIKDWFN